MTPPVVLVFRVGQLGDSLVALPAVRAIRAAHPDARLVLLTDRQRHANAITSWEVFAPTGLFDDVEFLNVPSRPADYLAAARAVREWAPARVYYLPPMPRSWWQVRRDWLFFRLLCGIGSLVGLHSTPPYPVRDGDGRLVRLERESDRLLRLATSGRLPPESAGAHRLTPLAEHRRVARAALERADCLERPLIALGPGSKMQATQWPEEHFAAAGHDLLRRVPTSRLVVLGARHERALGDRLCASWGSRSLNLAGELSVWESAAVLERCAVYVGNDTGTMHLAASVDTPCVAVFSARDNPGKWEPAGGQHVVLRQQVPCEGCALATCRDRDRACLRATGVDAVVAAVVERLDPERLEWWTARSSASAS